MKRKTAILLLVLVTALLIPANAPANAPRDDINCILGFVTRDWDGNPFCQYTLPPGSCVICYASIVVRG